MENTPQPRLEDPFGNSPNAKTTPTQGESRTSNLRLARRVASRRALGELYYSQSEIDKLTKEIYDDTINEVLLNLFIDWIRQKPENFAQARDNIRELGLDQEYDTARVHNASLKKLLDDVADLRPAYQAQVLSAREGTISLAEMLREEATQENPLPSRKWLRPMPALKSPRLFSRNFEGSPLDSKARPGTSSSDDEGRMFEFQMANPISSPLPSPLLARPASAATHSLKKTPSLVTSSLRSRSQQYPPDTPDRPAPLNIRPRTASGSIAGAARSVSTPSRTRLPSSPLAFSAQVSPSSECGADLPGAVGVIGEEGEEEDVEMGEI